MAFDPEVVHAKYLAERDKRLVPGRTAIRDLTRDEYVAGYRADPFTPYTEREAITDDPDVVIVGGGIAGILAGAHLRKAGIERIRIVDQAGGIGGTWYWNRYPGVMCDVESYQYLPMLEELDYIPTRRYAYGEEIRLHLQAIADRFDLVPDALFHTGVTQTIWDDGAGRWQVHTDRGDELSCRYYVLAVGILNLMKLPAIPGMDDFDGRAFHTARWDYGFTGGGPGEALTDLGDKVVALIGTGASGLQCLPPLAEAAKHVYVFQRTPSAIGVRGNRPTDPSFAEGLQPGWQKARMDNFQSIMLGRPVDADLTDDGWTHHYAAVQNPPRREGHEHRRVHAHRRRARLRDHGGAPPADRSSWSPNPTSRPRSSRTTATCASGPASTTSTSTRTTATTSPSSTAPPASSGSPSGARSSTDSSTRSTASSTAPASRQRSHRCRAASATTSSAGAASRSPRSGPTAPPPCSA